MPRRIDNLLFDKYETASGTFICGFTKVPHGAIIVVIFGIVSVSREIHVPEEP